MTNTAIDAGASHINVTSDAKRGQLSVQDNGGGISPGTFLFELSVPKSSKKVKSEGIGRFGVGFFTVFAMLTKEGDEIRLRTRTPDAPPYEVIYGCDGDDLTIDIKVIEDRHMPVGTYISIKSDAIEAALRPMETLTHYFKYHTGAHIVCDAVQVNNQAMGRLHQVEDSGVYLSKTVQAQASFAVILLKGVTIYRQKLAGFHHLEVVWDFSFDTELPESRGMIKVNASVVADVKARMDVIKKLPTPELKAAYANSLYDMVQHLQGHNESKIMADDLLHYYITLVSSEFSDAVVYPNHLLFREVAEAGALPLHIDLCARLYPDWFSRFGVVCPDLPDNMNVRMVTLNPSCETGVLYDEQFPTLAFISRSHYEKTDSPVRGAILEKVANDLGPWFARPSEQRAVKSGDMSLIPPHDLPDSRKPSSKEQHFYLSPGHLRQYEMDFPDYKALPIVGESVPNMFLNGYHNKEFQRRYHPFFITTVTFEGVTYQVLLEGPGYVDYKVFDQYYNPVYSERAFMMAQKLAFLKNYLWLSKDEEVVIDISENALFCLRRGDKYCLVNGKGEVVTGFNPKEHQFSVLHKPGDVCCYIRMYDSYSEVTTEKCSLSVAGGALTVHLQQVPNKAFYEIKEAFYPEEEDIVPSPRVKRSADPMVEIGPYQVSIMQDKKTTSLWHVSVEKDGKQVKGVIESESKLGVGWWSSVMYERPVSYTPASCTHRHFVAFTQKDPGDWAGPNQKWYDLSRWMSVCADEDPVIKAALADTIYDADVSDVVMSREDYKPTVSLPGKTVDRFFKKVEAVPLPNTHGAIRFKQEDSKMVLGQINDEGELLFYPGYTFFKPEGNPFSNYLVYYFRNKDGFLVSDTSVFSSSNVIDNAKAYLDAGVVLSAESFAKLWRFKFLPKRIFQYMLEHNVYALVDVVPHPENTVFLEDFEKFLAYWVKEKEGEDLFSEYVVRLYNYFALVHGLDAPLNLFKRLQALYHALSKATFEALLGFLFDDQTKGDWSRAATIHSKKMLECVAQPHAIENYISTNAPESLRPALLFLYLNDEKLIASAVPLVTEPDYYAHELHVLPLIAAGILYRDYHLRSPGKLTTLLSELKEKADLAYPKRVLQHAIHHQSFSDLWFREIIQNALDAMRSTRRVAEIAINIQKNDKNSLVTTFSDNGEGMAREDVLNYFCIPEHSSKRVMDGATREDEHVFIGGRGIGMFTMFQNAQSVFLKTSIGDGILHQFYFEPVHDALGRVRDIKVSFDSSESAGDFQGTTLVRKSLPTPLYALEAARLSAQCEKHARYVPDSRAHIVLNNRRINGNAKLLSSNEVDGFGHISLFEVASDQTGIVFTAGGLFVELETDIYKIISSIMQELFFTRREGHTALVFDLPAAVALIRDRSGFMNRDALMAKLRPVFHSLTVEGYLKAFLKGYFKVERLPVDFYASFFPYQKPSFRMPPLVGYAYDALRKGLAFRFSELLSSSALIYHVLGQMPLFSERLSSRRFSLFELAMDYRTKEKLPDLDAAPYGLRRIVAYISQEKKSAAAESSTKESETAALLPKIQRLTVFKEKKVETVTIISTDYQRLSNHPKPARAQQSVGIRLMFKLAADISLMVFNRSLESTISTKPAGEILKTWQGQSGNEWMVSWQVFSGILIDWINNLIRCLKSANFSAVKSDFSALVASIFYCITHESIHAFHETSHVATHNKQFFLRLTNTAILKMSSLDMKVLYVSLSKLAEELGLSDARQPFDLGMFLYEEALVKVKTTPQATPKPSVLPDTATPRGGAGGASLFTNPPPTQSLEALKKCGNAHYAKKNYDDALACWNRALSQYPSNLEKSRLYSNMAIACLCKKDFLKAKSNAASAKAFFSTLDSGLQDKESALLKKITSRIKEADKGICQSQTESPSAAEPSAVDASTPEGCSLM